MKKVLFPILALVLAVGLAVPAAAHTETDPFSTDLIAGQNMVVGDVKVWNDGTNLYVKYATTGSWEMTETHLHVAEVMGAIPQKNGNPIPGQFDWSTEHDPWVTEYTYVINLADKGWVPCTTLYIATHAVVVDTSSTETMTIVSEPGVNVYGPLDHYAGLSHLDWSTAKAAVATWVHGSWPSIPGATWISTAYYVEDVVNDSWRWFHDEMTIPSNAYNIAGTAWVNSDNAEEFYFNGALVGSDGEVQVAYYDNAEWGTIISYPITPQPGLNSLDFIVRNYAAYYPDIGGTYIGGDPADPKLNPAGLIYKAEVNYYLGETAWGADMDFPGKNWATYFEYHVQHVVLGDWSLEYWFNGGEFAAGHNMSITEQDQDGSFDGTGYSVTGPSWTWNVTGTVTDSTVSMTITYDQPVAGTYPYVVSLTGTIGASGSMSGTATDNRGHSYTWTATRVP